MPTPTSPSELKPFYTVQEAAAHTGLSVHTLRYYERAGLMEPVPRDSGSRHRRYSDQDIRALEFLKKMRLTGMPIREMQRFMALARKGDSTAEERLQLLEAHGKAVRQHLSELQSCLETIEYKIANYAAISAAISCDTKGNIK